MAKYLLIESRGGFDGDGDGDFCYTVYIVEEDLAARGIESSELIDSLETVSRGVIAKLVSDYDHVWHW